MGSSSSHPVALGPHLRVPCPLTFVQKLPQATSPANPSSLTLKPIDHHPLRSNSLSAIKILDQQSSSSWYKR